MAILTHDDGMVPRSPEEAEQAEAAGYKRCYTAKNVNSSGAARGLPCSFYLSPEAQSAVTSEHGGYFTCPKCSQSHDLLHEMPWHGVTEDEWDPETKGFAAGGGTRIGLPMQAQAQIGEDLVEKLGEIPGYGPITWWHQGGTLGNSPLDGATKDWGIEVKTLGYDARHHRYVPGRVREKLHKNEMALSMGKKGILGVLVLLDYKRSVADIYVQEHPVRKDPTTGAFISGTRAFRSSAGMHLVKEVPFRNPLMDPHDPSPVSNQAGPVDTRGEAMAF